MINEIISRVRKIFSSKQKSGWVWVGFGEDPFKKE